MRVLFEEAVATITPEKWQKSVAHTKKIEKKMWDLDNIMEIQIDPVIINLQSLTALQNRLILCN